MLEDQTSRANLYEKQSACLQDEVLRLRGSLAGVSQRFDAACLASKSKRDAVREPPPELPP